MSNCFFRVIIVCGLLLMPSLGWTQLIPKSLQASRAKDPPKIDGILDDICWQNVTEAEDFVINDPTPGVPLKQRTSVKVVYNHEALYVAFSCEDSAPDSILKQLSGRDQSGNTDYCGIQISCYRDGINGFSFNVTPNAEQYDARLDNAGEDLSWNAVWYCKTSIHSGGWVAEYKIPFAAIRFPDQPDQLWNINFVRSVRRLRHTAYWNPVNPLIPGILTQMGTLSGISQIKPPARIFFYPYASGYYNTDEKESGEVINSYSYNTGLDLKLGLSDAFTLDATLIPDFGQTISDQQILNLSAFEVQFTENRQFFTEGTELFSRGGIFYSRRIGFERPFRYGDANANLNENEIVTENPVKDQVLNAIKISGRDKNKLGIGFFNAVTSPSLAVIRDTMSGVDRNVNTSSLTNYNVLVLDQILPNNSYVSLINTNVWRGGSDYDVNVMGTSFELRDKGNDFGISGTGILNTKYGPAFSGTDVREDNGFRQELALKKLSGNWTVKLGEFIESDTYDPTDLGFLQANNEVSYYFSTSYNIFKPFGRFNRMWTTLTATYNQLYKPHTFTSSNLLFDGGITTKKFNTYGLTLEHLPVRGYDYFEPRVWGKQFRTYRYFYSGGWYSSDYRKKIALDIGTWISMYENPGRYRFNWRIAPRFRLNDHLFITYVYSYQSHINDIGFAYQFEDDSGLMPLFGKRDVISHTNVLTVKYAFNPVMTINTRLRHYWGYTQFKEFYSLQDDGYLSLSDETASDQSFNTFTIDLVYSWIFKPGSELSLVWKNAITDFDSSVPVNLLDDVDYTFGRPQSNSYSLKLIYFLDYHTVTDLATGRHKKDF